jgi:hypothetical protein
MWSQRQLSEKIVILSEIKFCKIDNTVKIRYIVHCNSYTFCKNLYRVYPDQRMLIKSIA